MAITQGELEFPYRLQPNRTIVERLDGTLESQIQFVTQVDWLDYLPEINDPHPDDNRLELHTLERTYTTHNLVTLVGSYLGLKEDPTDPVLTYVGTPDREIIQTHPDFAAMAGTPKKPANGARWVHYVTRQVTTDNEAGFFESFSTNATSELYGVQYYLKPSTQVNLTWWQTKVPTVERMKIVDEMKPFKKPDDVENFLIVDTPYRQVGNHYQVTQIGLGSDSTGWSTLLYPQT